MLARVLAVIVRHLSVCPLKVTHPFRKSRFRHISLNSASAVKASEKVQLSLIGSRQCAFHRAIDEHCALSLSPQRVAQNENFYVFLHSFHIFVAGYCRHFKFAMQIHHSKSQHTDDKLSLKWAWSRHVIHFWLESSNFLQM